MNKNKPHKNWNLFLENAQTQLPLGPPTGSAIKPRPSVRIDPVDPDPDIEREVGAEELALLLQKTNSKNPAIYQQASDRDFNSPMADFKISLKTDSEQSFANDTVNDEEDKKAKDRIQSFWDVAQYTDTIDLKNLEEMIREELIKILNETYIHRKK